MRYHVPRIGDSIKPAIGTAVNVDPIVCTRQRLSPCGFRDNQEHKHRQCEQKRRHPRLDPAALHEGNGSGKRERQRCYYRRGLDKSSRCAGDSELDDRAGLGGPTTVEERHTRRDHGHRRRRRD